MTRVRLSLRAPGLASIQPTRPLASAVETTPKRRPGSIRVTANVCGEPNSVRDESQATIRPVGRRRRPTFRPERMRAITVPGLIFAATGMLP